MTSIDFAGAWQYALRRLEAELSPLLTYHSIAHTRDDILSAAKRLAALEQVEGENLNLLFTAVWYHDIGFVENRAMNHEAVGVRIAAEALPRYGFGLEEIRIVSGMIWVTQIPQSPSTHLEEIMADADLDLLGRDDFWSLNQALRAETAALGQPTTGEEWYSSQLVFLQTHKYFTASARSLRAAGKKRNIEAMSSLLEQCRRKDTEEGAMLSLHDRVALLRSVRLFAETADDVLVNVAALLQPVAVGVGESVFHKGDEGDCMYIIVEGRARAHDGELILNHLGVCDVFGEMALLDTEPRVASITAVEETHLLRLDRVPFQELMANQTSVALGVIHVLSRWLRERVRDMAQDFDHMQQIDRIAAAAAALETGRYDSRSLNEVGRRQDELGQLARVFQRMADEVIAREQRLKQEVQALRIQIDEEKRKKQVAEITDSDYFQAVQKKAQDLKKR